MAREARDNLNPRTPTLAPFRRARRGTRAIRFDDRRPRRPASLLCILLLIAAFAPIAVAREESLLACLALPTDAERSSCLDHRLADHPLAPADLGELEEEVEHRPEAVAAIVEAALRGRKNGPHVGAGKPEILELYARALQGLGRNNEAAAAWIETARLEPGTERFTWRDAGGATLWTVDTAVGSGRLLRAATGLAATGRPKEARELTARALIAGAEDEARRLWRSLGGGIVPGLDPEVTPLAATPLFPAAPDVTLKLLGRGKRALSSFRGKVVLLDFWASWCPPCIKELPTIEALYRKERGRGLAVVAVNAQEEEPAARSAVERMGLTMPVARYDGEMDRAFHVRSLPVLVLVDRDGRIRARWDGYRPQLATALPRIVEQLLGADPEGAPRQVAEVRAGAGRFDVMWSAELPAPVTGMVVLAGTKDEAPALVAVARGSLVTLDAGGRKVSTLDAPPGVRRVRSSGDRPADLVGFRTAGRDVVILDPAAGEEARWRSPYPVLDVSVAGKTAAVGTTGGCYLLSLPEGPARVAGEPSEIRSVRWIRGDAGPELVLLKTGEWIRFRLDGTVTGRGSVPRNDRRLLAGPKRVGTGPGTAPAVWARGLLKGGAPAVALAGGEREFAVVSAESGEVLFRSRWDQPILDIEAADLDGDGADEVLVVSLGRITALRRAEPPESENAQ